MMRRSTFVSLTAAALAGCAHRASSAPQGAPGLPAVRIVALGDSLAVGVGASAPENGFIFQSYLRVLARRPESRIDDFAIGGARVADVVRLQIPRLAHHRADIAIVCVGANDVVRHTSPARFAASYGELVERLRTALPTARLIACGVPDVALSPLFTGGESGTIAHLSAEDDAAIRAVAKNSGSAFADLYALTRRDRADAAQFLSDDRFHPSDAGYAAFAAILTPLVLRAAAH